MPVLCFTLIFCCDLLVYTCVDNVWALAAWTLVGIFPKGCVCAFSHHHQHVATFKSTWLNRALEQMYALQTGVASNAWVLHHALGHHVNYLDQTKDESGWTDDDGSTMGWFKYTVWNTLQAYPRAWQVGRRYPSHQRVLLVSALFLTALVMGMTLFRPLPALFVFILPMLISLFATVYATHGHHAGKSTDTHFVACNNIMHGVYNIATGNLGYHTAHHYRPGVHWSRLPALHATIEAKIPADCYVPADLPYTLGDHAKALVSSMRRLVSVVLALVMAASIGVAGAQRRAPGEPNYDAFYELGPDSLVRRGVPKGKVAGPFKLPTEVFPGVDHDYWVYVPAQYDGKTEVGLMVFNDGATYLQPDGYYRAVNVLDNLIHRRELPVMVAAFIDPGKFTADGKSNRQAEYDPVNDRYSRVIVNELLPKLYAEYRISRDADRHGIAGWSSGAIAAFTVAWERPDHFRKVLSGIGTYVDLAGGHVYPEKVMASERKPIRIFMIDGRNDNRGVNADGTYDPTRDWFYQNVRLKDALVAKGYDVNHAWGIGVHSHDMGGAMLPEMMRWLWRDQPVSVDPHDTVERSFRQ